ncbi:MAG: cytochrome b/b6 domain-containing protein, partial [Candidatus Acidiferrales bacterium]
VYEHPWPVRFCHWLNSVSLLIMMGSGLQIFLAFPSFGPKVGEKVFFRVPHALALGGWLGGALQWHITFGWIYALTGAFYLGYQVFSRHYRQVLFTSRDVPGVWPMVRHYFFFGHQPAVTGAYNPLQKLAYTSAVVLGILSVLTGLALYSPVQYSFLASLMGGFHLARVWHFAVMCGLLLFLIGHLIMVILHGWNNLVSMFTGWKKNPEYL